MSRTTRTVLIYLAVIFLVVMAVSTLLNRSDEPAELTLNEFETQLAAGDVDSPVDMKEKDNEITGTLNNAQDEFVLRYPGESEAELTQTILDANVDVDVIDENPSLLEWFIGNVFPYLLLFGLFIFLMYQLQGSGNKVMQFGKSKAKLVTKDQPKVTFDDIAGIDEAIEELEEIKEFLEQPQKFRAMGAKIPKGVLLYGPPGTGKTLLARAVAGEAGVPFYAISGSEFVEMFVGVGASRVRDLFEQAKANAPSIVFIDEIDAVGRHRGAGLGGGHDEREQTLNQLLVELDGFDPNSGVIVIASTNRPDILDPALLRPGRFDRQIVIDRPDIRGREQILDVHARGKPLADDISTKDLARMTPGFTGADLANLINEAALLAARRDQTKIGMKELEEAIERVVAGPERKSRVMSDEERELTAYHEGGHALVGYALPKLDPIHKVTIIPRGRAGGYTMALPVQDRYYEKRSELVDQLAYALGGRTAEEIVFGDPSTGATNDIEKATALARKMVMEFGMSDRLGPLKYGSPEGEVFLGRDYTQRQDLSNEVAAAIDDEVRTLITQAHEEATQIITAHRDALDRIAKELMENETLDAAGVSRVLHDVPKWEHTVTGALRIKGPDQAESKTGIAAAQTGGPTVG
ncbi:MAG: ATP-dependent zinc metalloprotease FtsH [Acidimicrobiia bacterium]|nr:MAG: ATP-dependent zinc metalloprotease FtsH [Acidimicrobiia bacterium]